MECRLVRAATGNDFLDHLEREKFSVVISNYPFPHCGDDSPLYLVKQRWPQIVFIVFTRMITAEKAIQLLNSGVTDILLPPRHSELASVIAEGLNKLEDHRSHQMTQHSLRENTQKFRALAESLPSPVFVYKDSQVLFANKAAQNLTGYSSEELAKRNFFELIASEHREIASSRRGSVPVRSEIKISRKDHSERWLDFITQPFEFDGAATSLATALDISERKQERDKLQQQATLLEMMHDAVAIATLEGKLQYFNKASDELFGWSQETIGKSVQEALRPANPQKVKEAWDKIFSEGKWTGQLEVAGVGGGQKIVIDSRWNIINAPGQPKSVLLVNTDVSESKIIEAQSARADRMQAIGTLAGGLSHDLNNTLTPCLMAVHLLRPKLKEETAQKYLNTLETSLERAAGIVRQVLVFARGVEGQRTLIHMSHLLKLLMKTAVESFPNGIRVEQNWPKDLWLVNADPAQIREAVLNLCNNARDAMPNGGRLTISADNVELRGREASLHPDAKSGPYVMISVRDTGSGIAKENLRRVFDPFFTTKEPGKGTGLGLSTAMGIIRSHGGFINVTSSPGAGAEFMIYLPASPEATFTGARPGDTAGPSGKGELILVVDDEAAVREITSSILETYGYNVLLASDGTEALAAYSKEGPKINAIIMDIVMPHLDGIATIRALDKLGAKVGIIVTTGLATHQEEARKASSLVRGFINKPYSPEALLRILREALEETGKIKK
jgi:two-component system cell cycle sensor histidine kinase/response regulator CckA